MFAANTIPPAARLYPEQSQPPDEDQGKHCGPRHVSADGVFGQRGLRAMQANFGSDGVRVRRE